MANITEADAARAAQDADAEAIPALPWDDDDGDPSPVSPAPTGGDVAALTAWMRDYAKALDEAVIEDVVDPLEADGARILTEQIATRVADLLPLLLKACTRRAADALGYESWPAYTDAELCGLRLPPDEQRAAVVALRAEGMTVRAIGQALGMSDSAVRRELRDATTTSRPSPSLPGTAGGAANPGAPAASHQDHPQAKAGEADARLDAAPGPVARGEALPGGAGPGGAGETAAEPATGAADAAGESGPQPPDAPATPRREEPRQPGPDLLPQGPAPVTPDDPLVWVAVRRSGIRYHAPVPELVPVGGTVYVPANQRTVCERSTRTGEILPRSEAEALGAVPCGRCFAEPASPAHTESPARRDPDPAPAASAIATTGGPGGPTPPVTGPAGAGAPPEVMHRWWEMWADLLGDLDPDVLAGVLDADGWQRAANLRDVIDAWFERLFASRPETREGGRDAETPAPRPASHHTDGGGHDPAHR